MRPIDADAFYKNLVGYAPPEMVWDAGDIEHKLDEMPTLTLDDIVPHGRWEQTKDGDWECSNCKEAVNICVCGKDKTRYKPFCPNCMAKMDLEENNG